MDLSKYRGHVLTALENVTANGFSLPFESASLDYSANIYVTGDLGGGNITIEALAPNGIWVPIAGDPINAVGLYSLSTFPFIGRVVLSDASSANVSVFLHGSVILTTIMV